MPGIYATVGDAPNEQLALILYDSVDVMQTNVRIGFFAGTPSDPLPRAARAEARAPTVLVVQGGMVVFPASFVVGNRVMLKVRLGWFEQDTETGLLSVQAEYQLWSEAVGQLNAVFSNDNVSNIKTQTLIKAASTDVGPSAWYWPFFWKGRRKAPSPKHCLALLVEGSGNSLSSTRLAPEYRAFVHDPNS